eukprot:249509-Pyramimonas_sp.AAC.1
MLPATRERQLAPTSPDDQHQTYLHRFVQRSYGSGPTTNNQAGVANAICNLYRIKCVTTPPSPPQRIQGRAGAVRLRRGGLDTKFTVAYPSLRSGLAKHHYARVKRTNQTQNEKPTWSMPSIGPDQNDTYGQDGLPPAKLSNVIGDPGATAVPGAASAASHDTPDAHGRCILNNAWNEGPTYICAHGQATRPDYIAVPQ